MALTETNLKWVRGNTLNLAVPLQVVTAANGAQTKVDYTPPAGSEIRVYLVGRHGSIEYEPKLNGNVVSFTDNGSLALGDYGLEITIKEPSARNLRAFMCCAIHIVNSSEELGKMPDGQVALDAALFLQTGSGGGVTEGNLSPEVVGFLSELKAVLDNFNEVLPKVAKGSYKVVDVTEDSSVSEHPPEGTEIDVLYVNDTEGEHTVTISSSMFRTSTGQDLLLVIPPGWYAEANFLNIDGTVYVRGM